MQRYNIIIIFFFFRPQKVDKTTLKSCSEKLKSTLFSLLTWAAQTAQTEEFMFQNVAYRPTVQKAGESANKKVKNRNYVFYRKGCVTQILYLPQKRSNQNKSRWVAYKPK